MCECEHVGVCCQDEIEVRNKIEAGSKLVERPGNQEAYPIARISVVLEDRGNEGAYRELFHRTGQPP